MLLVHKTLLISCKIFVQFVTHQGSDGFGGIFYRHCWEIISEDVIDAIKEFFITGEIFILTNCNFMVLIPKHEATDSLDKFRPIVLGKFFFKINAKIIADRQNGIASQIISQQ